MRVSELVLFLICFWLEKNTKMSKTARGLLVCLVKTYAPEFSQDKEARQPFLTYELGTQIKRFLTIERKYFLASIGFCFYIERLDVL